MKQPFNRETLFSLLHSPRETLGLVIFSFPRFQRAVSEMACDIKCFPDDQSGQIEPNKFLQR